MKTTLRNFAIGLSAVLALAVSTPPAIAQQNTMYSTTLSNAMTVTQIFVCLASASNIVVPTTSAAGSRLFVDHEAMDIQSVTTFSSTCWNVSRQHNAAHAKSAKVWFGPPNWFSSVAPQGGAGSTCTLSALYAYPVIVPSAGAGITSDFWRCVASVWVAGASQNPAPYTAFTTLNPPFNLLAPAAITDTVAEYWSQIFIPADATLTGACLLNGATVTTDKHIVFLADSAGTIIANSALAGASDSGASRYQCQAFTATVDVVGGASYYVGTQPNGTTDTFYTYTAAGAPTGYQTGTTAAGVFGTLVNVTPTTSFTTAIGPLMMVY